MSFPLEPRLLRVLFPTFWLSANLVRNCPILLCLWTIVGIWLFHLADVQFTGIITLLVVSLHVVVRNSDTLSQASLGPTCSYAIQYPLQLNNLCIGFGNLYCDMKDYPIRRTFCIGPFCRVTTDVVAFCSYSLYCDLQLIRLYSDSEDGPAQTWHLCEMMLINALGGNVQ